MILYNLVRPHGENLKWAQLFEQELLDIFQDAPERGVIENLIRGVGGAGPEPGDFVLVGGGEAIVFASGRPDPPKEKTFEDFKRDLGHLLRYYGVSIHVGAHEDSDWWGMIDEHVSFSMKGVDHRIGEGSSVWPAACIDNIEKDG